MELHSSILKRLDNIERLILDQKAGQKEILSFDEACLFLGISSSNLYKLTSGRQIPHSKLGGLLRFRKSDLNDWISSKRIKSMDDIQKTASSYTLKNGRI